MIRSDVSNLETIGREVAVLAGDVLLSRFGDAESALYTKARPVDIVGQADLDAEKAIADRLAALRPGDGLISEEVHSRDGTTGVRWIVDPLDGTINYLRGIPHWAVSVACEADGELLIGVVHDPLRCETFAVSRGCTPTLNGAPLRQIVSRPMAQAVLTGTIGHTRTPALDRQGLVASRIYASFAQVRAMGSAALDLAWTAAGRYDAFYHEEWAHIWDIAAGSLMCREAGLEVRELTPAATDLSNRVVVAHPELVDNLVALVDGPPPA